MTPQRLAEIRTSVALDDWEDIFTIVGRRGIGELLDHIGELEDEKQRDEQARLTLPRQGGTGEDAALLSDEREHVERLRTMLEDDGETWDLSPNDKDAINFALETIVRLRAERAILATALRGNQQLREEEQAIEQVVRARLKQLESDKHKLRATCETPNQRQARSPVTDEPNDQEP